MDLSRPNQGKPWKKRTKRPSTWWPKKSPEKWTRSWRMGKGANDAGLHQQGGLERRTSWVHLLRQRDRNEFFRSPGLTWPSQHDDPRGCLPDGRKYLYPHDGPLGDEAV